MFSDVKENIPQSVRNSKLLARKYTELGLAVIPVPCGQKGPIIKGWQNLKLSLDKVESAFTETDNIGVLLGSSSGGLVDLDLDCPESRIVAPAVLKNIDSVATYGREQSPRSHYLFYSEGIKPIKYSCPRSKEVLLELRSDGQQSLFPGSLHPTGDVYRFDECSDNIVMIDCEKLIQVTSRIAGVALLVKHWPKKGSRQDAALALAGGLIRAGKDKEKVGLFIKNVAEYAGDEEADQRVKAVNYTAEKLAAGYPVTGWPRLSEIIDPKVVTKFREWLHIEVDKNQEKNNRRQGVLAAVEVALNDKEPGIAIMDNEDLMKNIDWMKRHDMAGYDQVEKMIRGIVNLNNFHKAVKSAKRQDNESESKDLNSGGFETIVKGNASLKEHRLRAYEAISKHNSKSPFLFRRSGELVSVRKVKNNHARIELLGLEQMRNILADYINWGCEIRDMFVKCYPPIEVAKAIMADNSLTFPPLNRIVKVPVFGADGSLLTRPGYHQGAGTWLLDSAPQIDIKNEPSKEEVVSAKNFIMDNVFVDFPFKDDSSIAYTFAVLLLPFIRQMIDGPTPLHLFDAISGAGTGKSLLAELITTISTGEEPAVLTDCVSDEEWRKMITAKLISGPNVILIDNLKWKLDSGALSAALTGRVWEGRLLGKSEIVSCPVEATWMATGNNIETSREIVRRLVRISLDAETTQPWTRSTEKFKHTNIRSWVNDHHKELIEACLMMIQGWIIAGKPFNTKTSLGSFESWSSVIGGILEYAEIHGFLEDLSKIYEEADAETSSWIEFLEVWWDEYADKEAQASELYDLAKDKDLLLNVLGHKNERSQKSRLGKALKAIVGRHLDNFYVEKANTKGKGGVHRYKLLNNDFDESKKEGDSNSDHVVLDDADINKMLCGVEF